MIKYCEDCGKTIGGGRYCFTCQRVRDREHRRLHPLPPLHRRIWKGVKAVVAQYPVQVGLLGLVGVLLLWGGVKQVFDLGPKIDATHQAARQTDLEYLNATETVPAQSQMAPDEEHANYDALPDTEGETTIHLDHVPDTPEEAAAMLKFMTDHPGHRLYTLLIAAPGEGIGFSCDLKKQTLIRIHKRNSGGGSQEIWKGEVMYRLRAGADETGTLNDTPHGKDFAVMTTF
jgi:hypothetical protein